jgi:glycosyltransferase involved in cell wall biosynthesis
VGGVGEVVTPETGILVPPDDPGALAGAIVTLAGDPGLRARMGAAARARALELFSVARLVADVDALYTELLDGGVEESPPRR